MTGSSDRRRFLALAGGVAALGAAGCLGGGESPDGTADTASNGGGDGGSDGGDTDTDADADTDDGAPSFDFPPGADESGLVAETVVAGARQTLEATDRYRVEQRHDFDPEGEPTSELSFGYDVDAGTVHERLSRDSVEIERWRTPDRIVSRSSDAESDRGGRWRSATGDSPGGSEGYPFDETTVPALIEGASVAFDGIVTEGEGERPYARYVGELVGSDPIDLRQWPTARAEYRFESAPEGTVSLLLSEAGAIHAVEYELAGPATRLTYEGRETLEVTTDGRVEFTYDGLEGLSEPGWASDDAEAVRAFEITETSLGSTYSLARGPALPGTVELAYSEFYITAWFGEDAYIDRYRPRQAFDTRSGVVAKLDESLQFEWASLPGRDVFAEADRIEMSVYIRIPREGRVTVFHEERRP